MKIRQIIAVLLMMAPAVFSQAQTVGLKTNLLSDAGLSPNLGLEFGLAPKWTLDLTGEVNFWDVDSHRWRHWYVQPEARYWFCERFNGHFMGLHLLGGQYNVGGVKLPFGIYPSVEDYRYEGYYYGAGLAYGYQWVLGKHWSFEASLGLGYVRAHYDRYDCPRCGEWKGKGDKNYLGVTKAAISLIYVIK